MNRFNRSSEMVAATMKGVALAGQPWTQKGLFCLADPAAAQKNKVVNDSGQLAR